MSNYIKTPAFIFFVLVVIGGAYIYFLENNKKYPVVPSEDIEIEKININKNGYSFSYPKNVDGDYLRLISDPEITVLSNDFICLESMQMTSILGNQYCTSTTEEGAAGSIFSTYTYVFDSSDKKLSLTFTTRKPQCLNYDSPQADECQKEISVFDADKLFIVVKNSLKFD